MKYYLIAGEASGDLHGGRLIAALHAVDSAAQFRGWGGEQMHTAGMILAKHYRELAFMGVWQVLRNLPRIWRNFGDAKRDITDYAPDAVILIDYSGFNLRLAPWLKEQGYKVYYYISPQVWASRPKRVETIRTSVDRLFSILPFEPTFYQQYNYEVTYVGHPLIDVVADHIPAPNFRQRWGLDDRPIIALLPGSRRQEIRAVLPTLLTVVEHLPDYQFVLAGAPGIASEFYTTWIKDQPSVTLVTQQTYALLAQSHAALVTSGTATLEAALFGVPQIVCYRAGALFYALAKRIIQVPYIAIVNLIANQAIVPELVQDDLNPAQLLTTLEPLLHASERDQMLADYAALRQQLGSGGAAQRAARELYHHLTQKIPNSPFSR